MEYLLVPDLHATVEIDPELERRILHDEASAKLGEPTALVSEYCSDGGPRLTIGYVPPDMYTTIAQRQHAASLLPEPESAIESMRWHRELCRWGVRGWNLHAPYTTETVQHRGRSREVASYDVIDVIELRGWLLATVRAIHRYNTLSEEMKKK